MITLGILGAVWAVVTIRDMDISRPTDVVTRGPYRLSRNHMYVAWTLIYLGIGALVNTDWFLILLPLLAVFTHSVVLGEERDLARAFGDSYRDYSAKVRRYF